MQWVGGVPIRLHAIARVDIRRRSTTETAPNRDGVGAAFFGPGAARPLWSLATERLLRPPLRDGLHDLSTQVGISQKAVDERR